MSKSRIFLILCLSLIGGIFGGWLLLRVSRSVEILFITFLLVFSIIVFSVFGRERLPKVIGFVILFFVLGIFRWEAAQPKINPEHIAFYNDQGEMSFIGVVSREPDLRDTHTKLTLDLQNLQGKVLVVVPEYPVYHYGDKLKVRCALATPKEYSDFSYQDYLARFNIYAVCYPKAEDISLLSEDQGSIFYAALLKLKSKARSIVNQILPEPQAALLAAITLGFKQRIPQAIRDDFSKIGISHILAISGLHITLLSSLLLAVFLGLGLWRKHAFYLSTLFLVFYVLLIGAPASAVRAGIMGFLLLLAMHLGRLTYSTNSIVLAGTLMLLVNPKLLPYDLGFQLSFAAAFGIIFFYPLLEKWLSSLPRLWIGKKIIILTLSAQITALPLVIYHFGRLSLIAPLANILVVPLLPLLMILGFLSIVLGFIYWLLGWMFAWLVSLPLIYITKLSHYFSQIPYAFLEIKMHSWMVVLYYLLLVLFMVWYNRKVKIKI